MSVREDHAVVWDSSLVMIDVDPFTRCKCGNQLPCPVRVGYEQGLADAGQASESLGKDDA